MTQTGPRTKKELVAAGIPLTYDEWIDPCGQTYRPGDYVAVAVINGRSPQMVIGKVVKINRVNSRGEEIGDIRLDDGDDLLRLAYSSGTGTYQDWSNSRSRHFTPSCTVTVSPAIDGRGFGRYSGDKPKNVTYQFPGNIVKVELHPDLFKDTIDDLTEIFKSL